MEGDGEAGQPALGILFELANHMHTLLSKTDHQGLSGYTFCCTLPYGQGRSPLLPSPQVEQTVKQQHPNGHHLP